MQALQQHVLAVSNAATSVEEAATEQHLRILRVRTVFDHVSRFQASMEVAAPVSLLDHGELVEWVAAPMMLLDHGEPAEWVAAPVSLVDHGEPNEWVAAPMMLPNYSAASCTGSAQVQYLQCAITLQICQEPT